MRLFQRIFFCKNPLFFFLEHRVGSFERCSCCSLFFTQGRALKRKSLSNQEGCGKPSNYGFCMCLEGFFSSLFVFYIKTMYAFTFVPWLKRHSRPLSAVTLAVITVLKLTYVIAKINSKSHANGLLLDDWGMHWSSLEFSSMVVLWFQPQYKVLYNVVMTGLQ